MHGQYYLNLERYTLEKFKKSISQRKMIPSRVILKENIEERFEVFKRFNINNLKELIALLKTKDKIETFAVESGLSSEYLTIIKREASSYHPKPIKLRDFPDVDIESVSVLESLGIKNSKQLFNKVKKETFSNVSESTGVPSDHLNELFSLSDLARLYGVGPVFARMIYDTGVTSIDSFVNYTGDDFVKLYEKQTNKKADFSSADIDFSLELAREIISQ